MYQKGFTLIEIMIVVVIVGILASIAYPNYTDYLLKSARAEGKSHLLSAMQAQERHYSQTMSYTEDIDDLPGISATSSTQKYTLSIEKCGDSEDTKRCVLMKVTPLNGAASDPKCGVLSIDSRGLKEATGSKKDDDYCW